MLFVVSSIVIEYLQRRLTTIEANVTDYESEIIELEAKVGRQRSNKQRK
jgi:hypothetical protein